MASKTRPPQQLTREQIKKRTLQLNVELKEQNVLAADISSKTKSAEEYNITKQKFVDKLRDRKGVEAIAIHPTINPIKIMLEADSHPMSAAHMSNEACAIISAGHHARIREMLVVGYYIGLKFAIHERCFSLLSLFVEDARYRDGVPEKIIREKLLHYLFLYIFYQSGLETRDRATQYAQSLQYYFDLGTEPAQVDQLLQKYGQNKLRKAAQYRANVMAGARKWAEQGGDPSTVTMDEVLAAMTEQEAKSRITENLDDSMKDEALKHPTGDQRFKSNVEDLSDDAEWLEDNDPARNPHANYLDEEGQSDLADEGHPIDKPHKQAKIVCDQMLVSTTRMIVNILNSAMTEREKNSILVLIRQSWIKLMMLRVRLEEPRSE